MPTFFITPETCIKCGLCGQVCPSSVIAAVKGKPPRMRKGREADCIACGHCMVHCPTGAAHVDTLPDSECIPLDKGLLPGPDAVDMLCRSRRSVRRYTKKLVPQPVLEEILDVARYAPSAKNMQPLRWIGLYERSRIMELGNLVADWYAIPSTGPVKPLLQKSFSLLVQAWRAGDDPIFRGAPHLILTVSSKEDGWEGIDSSIALTYLELAAMSRGVGCCWAGYVTRAARESAAIQEFLGIKADEIVSGGQMVGYPAVTSRAIPPRKPLNLECL